MKEVFEMNDDFGTFNNPWYFPSVEEYKKVLEDNGFSVEYIELIPRPTPIDDISNWLDIFANGIVYDLTLDQKNKFKDEVKKRLQPKLFTEENGWVVDYVRLRVKVVRIS